MTGRTLLLTGATGLIGFQILLDALKADHIVRAVVRSPEKKARLLQHASIKEAASCQRLGFAIITDFSSPQAWGAALEGIDFVIHTASPLPLPSLDPDVDIFGPMMHVNASLLQAALKVPSLKRIVFTSSIVATMPLPPRGPGPYNAFTRYPASSGPFANVTDAYQAAKMQLLEQNHDTVKTHRPSFDVINIIPGYTFGRNESAQTSAEMSASSNGLLFALLKGRKFAGPRTAGGAHIKDVSKVHIKALGSDIPGNADYGVTVPIVYDAAIKIAKARFPEAFAAGIFNENGTQPSEVVEWDARATEERFGITFKSYEVMVTDTVTQYLELLEPEKNDAC
jgi:nucleoside-diphosphate-sugar epimerase